MLQLRKFLFLFMLCFLPVMMCAKEKDCMIFSLQSGAQVVILLDQEPKILFLEDGVYIGTDSYQFSELKNYVFGDSENLPDKLADVVSSVKFYQQNGLLFVSNVPMNSDIRLYTLLGQEVNCSIDYYSDDSCVIDINNLVLQVLVHSRALI